MTVTREELTRRGKEHYERRIRALVEPAHKGEYAAIDVHSGEYETGRDRAIAADKLRQRVPNAFIFFVRVGIPPVRLGGRLKATHP